MRSLIYIIVIFVGLVSKYQCVPVAQSTDTSQSGSAKTNPEYNLKLEFTEGDIVPHPLAGSVQGRGVAIRPAYQRWNGGIVPYEFAANLSSNDTAFIEKQMRAIENLTMVNNAQCVQFRPKNATDPYFITIFNGSGCSAPVGSWGAYVGVRPVSLLSGWYSTCMVSGIVQHELTHVLGLYHEQSRPDRDSYVSLQWANIIPVMHYERDAFAVNSSGPTIIPIMNATAFIGQRVQLSPIDILEIQRYYGCVPTPTSTTTTTASPSVSTTTRTTTTTTPPSVSTTTRTTTTTTASPSVSTTTRTTTTTTASPSVSTTTRTTTTTTASPSVSTTTRTTTTSNNNGNSSSSPTTAAAGFANNAGIPNAFSLHGEMYAVCFTFALYLINSIH
ncbi:hypothetical protein I4U23_012559 [Adineta vaga]|nr:hypothetical protein I4U23_012559 [Adineta vaga]